MRSIFEHGVIVWDPLTSCGNDKIETVPLKFLKYAAFTLNIKHPPRDYYPVMHRLCLSSMSDRGKVANHNFLNQLIYGYFINSPVLISLKVSLNFVSHMYPFFIPKC